MAEILGISLGTRALGVAILKDGELTFRKTYSFPGKWSPQKLKAILLTIEQIIRPGHIRHLAIKIADTLPSSTDFYQLIGGMNVYFEGKDLTVRYYTLSDMKQFYCPTEDVQKAHVLDCVILKYPDLIRLYRKEQKSSNTYYAKIFEAVAVARMLNDTL